MTSTALPAGIFTQQINTSDDQSAILHGSLIKIGQVTLVGVLKTNSSFSPGMFGMGSVFEYMRAFGKETFQIDLLIVGGHTSNFNDELFTSADIQATHLDAWSNLFNYTLSENYEAKEYSLSVSRAYENISATISSLETNAVFSTSGRIVTKSARDKTKFNSPDAQVYHTDLLKLFPNNPQTFNWFMKTASKIQQFLSICISKPVYILSFNLSLQTQSKNTRQFQAFFKQSGLDKADANFPENLLVGLQDAKSNLQQITNRYFENSLNGYEPIYNMLAEQNYTTEVNYINQFMNLCLCLKLFHRIRFSELIKSNNRKYEVVISPIVELINSMSVEDVSESLKSRMLSQLVDMSSNELDECLKRLNGVLSLKVLLVKRPHKFIEAVYSTYKYYSDFNEDTSVQKMSASHIYLSSIQLRLWILALAFLDMGVDKETLMENIYNSQYYNILHLNQNSLFGGD